MSEFKDRVNELVGKMTEQEDGSFTLPEEVAKDLDEPTLFAVTAERRVRDNQRAFSKAKAVAAQNEAVANALEQHILEKTELPLTNEQKHELAKLKRENPDAWRSKLNEYEELGRKSVQENLADIRTKSAAKGELEIRKDMMQAWSTQTGIELTDDIVANDVPPRFKNQLESGQITFEQFLTQVGDYLQRDKVIKGADQDTTDDTKSLSRVAGGKEPTKQANEKDFDSSYEGTIF